MDAGRERAWSEGQFANRVVHSFSGSPPGSMRRSVCGLPISGQLADWRAAIAFARTLRGVDSTKIAAWAFSASGGHIFRVAASNPVLERIEYSDTGGGPVVVLLHGLIMDASLWDGPIADLAVDHRCLAPTLPMPTCRYRGWPGWSQSSSTASRCVRSPLVDVDTSGVLVQLIMCEGNERMGRIVLASCEAFNNFPPGLTSTMLALAGKLSPEMFGLFIQQMRLRMLRRLPVAFGWLTKRGDAATARWVTPALT